MAEQKIFTLQRHIMEQQADHPEATGALTRLLSDLMVAIKLIHGQVSKAGLVSILGPTGQTNSHGETMMRLDVFAQQTIFRSMDHGGHLCLMASEESEEAMPIPRRHRRGKYVLVYDPLDGSSNIDANVSVGTIFSIYRKVTPGEDGALPDALQPGHQQVVAGYVIYGSSTMLVYTTGNGVHGFTLDPSIGEFLLSHPDLKTPDHGQIYSINEGYANAFDEPTRRFMDYVKAHDADTGRPYSARYIGSLVSDFHRNLLYGGLYLYPGVPKPKLRLVYEANPLALIAEQAGGRASDGTQRILDMTPTDLHQRTPLIIGSRAEVERYEQFVCECAAPAPK